MFYRKPRLITGARITALAVLILLGTTCGSAYFAVQARQEAAALRAHINGLGYPCRMWVSLPDAAVAKSKGRKKA